MDVHVPSSRVGYVDSTTTLFSIFSMVEANKLQQMIDFFAGWNIIRVNRTQHASQRCGLRWVFYF